MLDHIFLSVSDIERSIHFYEAALAPLGITSRLDYDGKDGPPGHPDLKGFGANGRMFFWLRKGEVEGRAVHVTPRARLYAGYTHREAEDAEGEAALTYEPEDMFRLSGTYDLLDGPHRTVVGGAVRWQGDIYKENSGPNGEKAEQGSYAVVDLMARQELLPGLTASLNLNNLLDRTYYTTFIYNGGFYGAPRNAEVKLRYEF